MAKIVECPCALEFWTDSDETYCGRCRASQRPTTYGLRFINGVAKPTAAFWSAWRWNPDVVKRHGFQLQKVGGSWMIRREKFR